jgi:biotin carboxyl carrier protein
MQYEVEVDGRLRQVSIRRVSGRFIAALDGHDWSIDAVRVDAHTVSLLIDEVPVSDEVRLKPDTTTEGRIREKVRPKADTTSEERASAARQTTEEQASSARGGVVSAFRRTVTTSHEVTLAPDAASGQLAVAVGAVPLTVTLNGRRKWGRRDEAATPDGGPQRIVAPMPGKIVRVLVTTGETVKRRQPLVVMEAMKMENELRALADGAVAELHVQEGQSVDAGTLLAIIGPASTP